jgi:hypothetical protein
VSIFKNDNETKRVIFNIDLNLAVRLERAKECSRMLGKKLDVDAAIDKELEKFLKKAEKKFSELGIKIESVTPENSPGAEPDEKAKELPAAAGKDTKKVTPGK